MDDPNRRHHIFDEPRHHLEPLVRQYGSAQAAGQAIENAVDDAFESASLVIDGDGRYKQGLDVGGNSVTVSGRGIAGKVHVGTAWMEA